MLEFILGFSLGIYIGTFYDCKPVMTTFKKHVNYYFPPKSPKSKSFKLF